MPARPSARRNTLRVVLGLAVGGLAIWLVVRAAGGLGGAWEAAARVQLWWLVPAVLSETLSYVFSGARLRRLAGPEAHLTAVSAVGVELVANGLGLLTPASPAEGLAFEASELSRRGLDRRRILLTLGFSKWFDLRIFLLVNALNILWILGTRAIPVSAAWPLAGAALVLIVLAATAILANRSGTAQGIAVAAGALRFWRPRPSPSDRRAAGARFHEDAMTMLGSGRSRIVFPLLSVAALLADAGCLFFVLIAARARVGFDIALLATGAAASATLVPLVPGGIGIGEAIIPAVVHWYGPSFGAALAAALLYRALGTFLPAVAGGVALLALRLPRPGARVETRPARSVTVRGVAGLRHTRGRSQSAT